MKTAIVTGASGNLGPVWVETLEEMGYSVQRVDLPKWDVTEKETMRNLAYYMAEVGRTPSVIVNNAGVDVPPGADSAFWSDEEHIIKVNLIGAANVTEAFLPYMISNRGGNITFIGSMLGFIASDPRNYTPPFDKAWAYGASKAGLWKFCKDCIVRYTKDGVVFNMLALSGVDGKQDEGFKQIYSSKIPIGRMLHKEDFINEFKVCVMAKVPYDEPLFVGGGYTAW
jgi:short-subunit dehydrogenase